MRPSVKRWYASVQSQRQSVLQRLTQSPYMFLDADHLLTTRAATAEPGCRLWVDGVVSGGPYLAVVGPRSPSEYAMALTRQLVGAVASQVTVMSGMAYGIDTLALRVAAAAGGKVVAVSPSGVATPVPAGSVSAVRSLVAAGCGAIVSEYCFVDQVGPLHFIHRNRLLAALADVVLVIEAAPRSGTMVTARLALGRGTTVATVPGDITRLTSLGSNALIRDGAQVVLEPADLFSLLDIPYTARQYPKRYQALVRVLERGITTTESIAEALALDVAMLARLLLNAERDSIVSRDQYNSITLHQGNT